MTPAQAFSPFGPAMHIPDGFLGLGVALLLWVITIAFVVLAARKSQHDLGERQVPLMGIMAAFIFAAEMLNFPVAGGTSGHLLGGALAAIVLGPWAAILVMTAVIGVQALLFQDGGLIVLGANIFNMGILTAFVGYGIYRLAANRSRGVRLVVVGVAAWLSVMAAAFATSLELWLSGTVSLQVVLPAMLGVHALIGIGEALITVAAVAFIMQVRPDLMEGESVKSKGGIGWVIGGISIALFLVLLAPFASASPDGLERVAEDVGFIGAANSAPYELLPDYTIPFLGPTSLSTIVAGIIGALVVAGLVYLIGRSIVGRRAATV